MIKGIIFDVGGVIVDFTNDKHYYPYLSKVSGVSLKKVRDAVENSALWAQLDKDEITQKEFDCEIGHALKIPESKVKWYEMYVKEGKINKNVLKLIGRLSRSYKIAYLSNVDLSRYTYTLKLLKQSRKLFDCRFASCYIHRRKPDTEVYSYILSRMKLKPEETIFIDNQKENVAGAETAGIKSILFKNIRDLEKRLEKLGIEL